MPPWRQGSRHLNKYYAIKFEKVKQKREKMKRILIRCGLAIDVCGFFQIHGAERPETYKKCTAEKTDRTRWRHKIDAPRGV